MLGVSRQLGQLLNVGGVDTTHEVQVAFGLEAIKFGEHIKRCTLAVGFFAATMHVMHNNIVSTKKRGRMS